MPLDKTLGVSYIREMELILCVVLLEGCGRMSVMWKS